ncbi:hypothetical protein L6164_006857 [Bauhinia variegata]|uniref:Uncharacterized protein n=2 Tax=Bauhinia variegata TaxID=167791 RepID=A0ACB9PVT8_BAUVA|nr:hypothetical protein L6164_006857 [Bauhinia variegata]
MAKGDDAVRKKKNKAIRKKLRSKDGSSNVSAKVAAMIAAKKRRQSGKRRITEGMCFSLPTPDDPFNDRYGKPEFKRMDKRKKNHPQKDDRVPVDGKSAVRRKVSLDENILNSNQIANEDDFKCLKNEFKIHVTKQNRDHAVIKKHLYGPQGKGCFNPESPSKYLIACLTSIESELRLDETSTDCKEEPWLGSTWGIEFWNCYSAGKDIMETGGNSASIEQIAWIVSSAADTIARKEKEGESFSSPFLLFLVHSQEKGAKVRSVCKPLKLLGIHTVSIHSGASIDHQIHGLKSCEPEFIVSTPERLLELVSLKAIDISNVSMLVIDGLNSTFSTGQVDMIKSIKNSISGVPHIVVFNDCFGHASMPMVKYLLKGPICRLSLLDSVTSLSSCIIQSVEVCTSEEEKLLKSIKVLEQSLGNKVLCIIRGDNNCQKLLANLIANGCLILGGSDAQSVGDSVGHKGRMKKAISVINMEQIYKTDIGDYDLVVLPSFVPVVDNYVHILISMARHSVNGVIYSFLTKEDREIAGPLIRTLEECGQQVPEALQSLCHT